MAQEFGGRWTEAKLERLKKYLTAYTKILKTNPAASYYQITYLDAFAGSGHRKSRNAIAPGGRSLFGTTIQDFQPLRKGSASIALEIFPPFDHYIFIDKSASNISELKYLVEKYPDKASIINLINADANSYLQRWCARTSWQRNRAVVFIDPYGMQVEWPTLKAIASTKAIDLWLLFPLGQGVNRLLTKGQPPGGKWAERLTATFGTEDWKSAFYQTNKTRGLFGDVVINRKSANYESIKDFFVRRLQTIFCEVSKNPLALINSKNIPIFLLCFAAGNPKGAKTAIKIADHILRS